MSNKSVSIIGGGYLGSRLVAALNQDKYKVKVSFRSKQPKTKVNAEEYIYCDVTDGLVSADNELFKADCLVICIPPGFRKGLGEIYPANITALVDKARKSGCNHVIYTSSTGIYPEVGFFDENAVIECLTPKIKSLYDAESAVLNSGIKSKQVLRLAGLMGEDRNPAKFPVKIENFDYQACVNMVMIDDVVSAIVALIEQPECPSNIYNISAPHHPTKNSFYRYLRQLKGEALPPFTEITSTGKKKTVEGNLICRELGFQYQYPNLFAASKVLNS